MANKLIQRIEEKEMFVPNLKNRLNIATTTRAQIHLHCVKFEAHTLTDG